MKETSLNRSLQKYTAAAATAATRKAHAVRKLNRGLMH